MKKTSFQVWRIVFSGFSLLFFFSIMPVKSFATELHIRGIAQGESKIKPGDQAPLVIPELKKANEEGKVIALILGYSVHCPWCDRMDRYIRNMMKETKAFNGKAIQIEIQTEPMKFLQPFPEGKLLKEAYGVTGQPWLYIIDKKGVVRYVYMMFVSSDVFKKNMEELVAEGGGSDASPNPNDIAVRLYGGWEKRVITIAGEEIKIETEDEIQGTKSGGHEAEVMKNVADKVKEGEHEGKEGHDDKH